MGAMTNMQRLVLVLAFVLAVLLGVLLATSLFGERGASPSQPPGPSVPAAVSQPPSGGASPSASLPPPSSAPPSPSASPSATPAPAAAAQISFVQLALDAGTDTGGLTRTISFASSPGTVSVTLRTESGGNSKVCVSADGTQLYCKTIASGTLTATTTKKTANFRVTLRGAGANTPVVDVTVAFPAQKPKVTIANARFDGTESPALNGIQAVVLPRAKGSCQMTASWGGHPFGYEVNLIEQGGPGLRTVRPDMGATKTSQSFAIAPPHSWMIVLRNLETGFGLTPLTATFAWP